MPTVDFCGNRVIMAQFHENASACAEFRVADGGAGVARENARFCAIGRPLMFDVSETVLFQKMLLSVLLDCEGHLFSALKFSFYRSLAKRLVKKLRRHGNITARSEEHRNIRRAMINTGDPTSLPNIFQQIGNLSRISCYSLKRYGSTVLSSSKCSSSENRRPGTSY